MTTSILTRAAKGSALTHTELDQNQTTLRDAHDSAAATFASQIAALQGGQAGGTLGFTTKALMDADLAHDANTLARVTNDSTATNNGLYIKLGASGSGSWQRSTFQDQPFVLGSMYSDDLNAAVAAIGSTPTTLAFTSDMTVSANITIPDTLELMPLHGAKINHTTYTISYAGPVTRWPMAQVFNGTAAINGFKEVRPEWFGGGDNIDSSTAFAACNASSGATLITSPGTTYLLDAVSWTNAMTITGGGTLKHKASGTSHMLSTTADLTLDSITVDGNRTNQTGRYDGVYFDGSAANTLIVQNSTIKSTVRTGIEIKDPTGPVDIHDCIFKDMANHGASSGQSSMGIYIFGDANNGQISMYNNKFIGNTPSSSASQATAIEAFVDYGDSSSLDISNNYFYQMGSNDNNNPMGAVDLYGQMDYVTITGNRFINSTYMAIKIKNCANPIVANNNIYNNIASNTGGVTQFAAIFWSSWDVALGTPPRTTSKATFSANNIDTWSAYFGYHIVGASAHEADKVNINGGCIENTFGGIILDGVDNATITGTKITGCTDSTYLGAGVFIKNSIGNVLLNGITVEHNAGYGLQAPSGNTGLVLKVANSIFDTNVYQHWYITSADQFIATGNTLRNLATPVNIAGTVTSSWLSNNTSDYPAGSSAATSRDFANSWNPGVYYGSGTPENVVTAIIGSTYNSLDNGTIYRKTTGSGNTGWVTP